MEIVSKTKKYTTIKVKNNIFADFRMAPDSEYDFATPYEVSVFDKYKDLNKEDFVSLQELLGNKYKKLFTTN